MEAITFLKEQIKLAIPEKFRNISELAEKAGVNQPNLNEFMNGKRKSLKLETAWKIMQQLGLEFAYIDNAQVSKKTEKQSSPSESEKNKALTLELEKCQKKLELVRKERDDYKSMWKGHLEGLQATARAQEEAKLASNVNLPLHKTA